MKALVPLLLLLGGLIFLTRPSWQPRVMDEKRVPRAALPREAEDWDEIGTYTLTENGRKITVGLYYFDSDSVADKRLQRGEFAVWSYPNDFSLHAIYQAGAGPWTHQKLYRVGRVGFSKVVQAEPGSVTLQLRSKCMIYLKPGGALSLDPDGTLSLDKEQPKRIYAPDTKRLTVENGVPLIQ